MEAGARRFLTARSIEQQLLLLLREILEGLSQIDLVALRSQLQQTVEILRPTARAESAVGQRLRPIGNHLRGIEVIDASQAMTLRACAISAIERKASRLQLGDVESAVRARHRGRIKLFLLACNCGKNQTVGHLQSFGHRGFESLLNPRFENDAIDDGFNGVFFVTFQVNGVGEIAHLTVNAGAEALLIQFVEQVLELAFAATDDRRIDDDAFSGRERKNTFHDLLGGLARNRFAALGAVRYTDRRVEEAEVVVDFSDCADSRSGTMAGSFLFDGDRRAESFDGVDIRPLDLVKELAGIRRERFYVASLALGIDGVESERRLAGSGKTSDHGKRVTGNSNIDVAQIVLTCSAHGDMSNGHEGSENDEVPMNKGHGQWV